VLTEGGKIKGKPRLSSDERRLAILEAAVPLFAAQGFRGVTTRHLAQEAGISEALLYQHFPSTEALYAAVQDHYFCAREPGIEALLEQTPSTATLVLILFLMAQIMVQPPTEFEATAVFPRLMLHSLMEDGAFARQHQERRMRQVIAQVLRSVAAARESGDLCADDGIPDEMRFWFAQHVLVMMHLNQLPAQPVVDYPAGKLDHVMRFALRGLGLTDAAILRSYHPEAHAAVVRQWLARIPAPKTDPALIVPAPNVQEE
jgi:AcrR family transcriptional regulator